MNLDPCPEIVTERLILRRMLPSDAADVLVFRSDKEVMRYIPRPLAVSIQDAENFIELVDGLRQKNESINWGIALKESGTVIGTIGYVKILPQHFRAEIGYCLAREQQRKGYMLEAIKAAVEFGFKSMKLHSIEAIIDAENKASEAILLRYGFQQEAYFKEDFFYNNQFRNSVHFGLLNTNEK